MTFKGFFFFGDNIDRRQGMVPPSSFPIFCLYYFFLKKKNISGLKYYIGSLVIKSLFISLTSTYKS